MWKFGNIQVEGQVVLGPMAGVTTKAFRTFMKGFGVSLCYTEMVSDMGLLRDNQNTMRYLEIDPSEHPVGIQLFGGQKETLVAAVEKLQSMKDDYDFIDINLGCPMPKVTCTGAGSAWLKDPQKLFEMLQAVVLASKKPVTCKIRLGWSDQTINVKDVAKIVEKSGISMLCIHSRTTEQLYTGKARHSLIEGLGKELSIPLVISGDIFTIEDAVEAMKITQATAVLVARGGIGRPHFVKQLDTYLKTGQRIPDTEVQRQADYIETLAKKLVAMKDEAVAIRELRGIATHFLHGYSYMNPFKVRLTSANTLSDVLQIVQEIKAFKIPENLTNTPAS